MPLARRVWFSQWQAHIKAGLQRTPGAGSSAASLRPVPLAQALLPLLCKCHPHEPRLAVQLPRLQLQRKK